MKFSPKSVDQRELDLDFKGIDPLTPSGRDVLPEVPHVTLFFLLLLVLLTSVSLTTVRRAYVGS